MPPVRTTKDKKPSAKYSRLSSYGFTKVSKEEELERAERAQRGKSKLVASSSKRRVAKRQRDVDDEAEAEDEEEEEEEQEPEPPKKKKLPKPVIKGEKNACFQHNSHWDGKYHNIIGSSTKKIEFGSGFVLTDEHIEAILAQGSRVTNSITDFLFTYADVSYDAHNSMRAVTEPTVVRLARSCPNLKKVQLQDTSGLGDNTFLAFCQHCPKITSLELLNCKVTGAGFDALQEHPGWVPKLKKLRITEGSAKGFMKGMRELTKERETLTVQLVETKQEKNWGDWDLITTHKTYKKGRKAADRSGTRQYGMHDWDDDREYDRYRMTGDISDAFLRRHGYY